MRRSDLRRARDERGEVLEVDRLGGGVVELTARLPHLAATARPGEFAQLLCGDGPVPLLRRPFSVAWSDGGSVAFVFEPVGAGTGLLAASRPGDALQALGPLGVGFNLDNASRLLCVAGGLGAAPFPLLIRDARRRGIKVTVINGAATAARLYPASRLRRDDPAVEVVEATDDGSRGHRGHVTDLVSALLTPDTAVAACGPNPMLASLARVLFAAAVAPLRAEASLEAPMGCGFGTCLGCALPVRPSAGAAVEAAAPSAAPTWALCCTEGPVMPVAEVDWVALAALPGADVA
ncbi:MAG: dihydroorotate dehydrogenase electron transfer subunit [Candidatus Dormibacteria bacterium]